MSEKEQHDAIATAISGNGTGFFSVVPPDQSTENFSNVLQEVNEAVPTEPSQKRTREPSPEARNSKRLCTDDSLVLSAKSLEVLKKKGKGHTSLPPQKQREFIENLQHVDQWEEQLNALSIDGMILEDIPDAKLREKVRCNLGVTAQSGVKETLLYMARSGWIKHRLMIDLSFQNKIDKKRMLLEQQSAHQTIRALQNQLQNQQQEAHENQIQPSQHQKPHIEPGQTLQMASKQQQSIYNSFLKQHQYPQQVSMTEKANILVIAREFERHVRFAMFAVVNLAALTANRSMSAGFYKQLTLLASENPDMSPLALVFGFCAQSNVHQTSAALILYDYLSGPLLDKLLKFSDTRDMRRWTHEFLQDALLFIAGKDIELLHKLEIRVQDTILQGRIIRASQGKEKDVHDSVHQDVVSSKSLLPLEDKSISTPQSPHPIPEPHNVVQVWQLPPRQQQLQSKLFNLHYQTDIARCLSCGASGHSAEVCTAIPADDAGESCELCGNFGPDQEQCGHLWRPTAPKMATPPRTLSTMIMSCYNCGSSDHWGSYCNEPHGLFRQ